MLQSQDRLPRLCKALIEPDFFPDFKAFEAPDGTAVDEAMDATVRESVGVSRIVESASG